MFGLLLIGVAGAYVAALALRRTVTKGHSSGFLMEMPKYQWPRWQDVALGLWTRSVIFLKRAGTTIAVTVALLWVLTSYPVAPAGQRQSEYSIAGRIASGIEVVVKPIGFNHDIALALLPAMAAREAAVAAIGTVYAVDDPESEAGGQSLAEQVRGRWTLPTALAFLMWFVFAPQCISTIAVTRRETNGWKWPLFMVGYLFAAAYTMAGITTGSRSPRVFDTGRIWRAASTRSFSSAIWARIPRAAASRTAARWSSCASLRRRAGRIARRASARRRPSGTPSRSSTKAWPTSPSGSCARAPRSISKAR
jgi:Fe2+ transport system protein B